MTETIIRTPEQKRTLRKWIRALRSGKYQQGRGTLCQFDKGEFKYCCLGVLGDIGLPGAEWRTYGTGEVEARYDLFSEQGVREGSGMLPQGTIDSLVGPGLNVDTLAAMNDGEGSNPRRKFTTIAKYIEQETGVTA